MDDFSPSVEANASQVMKEASLDEQVTSDCLPQAQAPPASRRDHHMAYFVKTKDDLSTLFENARTGMSERARFLFSSIDTSLPSFDLSGRMTAFSSSFLSTQETTTDSLKKPCDKQDDETSSTGTADTVEDLQDSFELLEDWQKTLDEAEEETPSVLRMRRMRARYLPFLSPKEAQVQDKGDCDQAKMWSLRVYQEAHQVRFHLNEKDKPATMILYNDEVVEAVQNIVRGCSCPSNTPLFELITKSQRGLQQLTGEEALSVLAEIVVQPDANDRDW